MEEDDEGEESEEEEGMSEEERKARQYRKRKAAPWFQAQTEKKIEKVKKSSPANKGLSPNNFNKICFPQRQIKKPL